MEQPFYPGAPHSNILDEVLFREGTFREFSDDSKKWPVHGRELLFHIRSGVKRAVWKMRRLVMARAPDTAEILYCYRILNMVISQQAAEQRYARAS